MAAFDQRADHHGGATDVVDVFCRVFAARAQIADQGRTRKHLTDIVEREGDAGFVGECRQMQRGVGRTAGGGDDGRAFSSAFRVTISRGSGPPRSNICITSLPACRAIRARSA